MLTLAIVTLLQGPEGISVTVDGVMPGWVIRLAGGDGPMEPGDVVCWGAPCLVLGPERTQTLREVANREMYMKGERGEFRVWVRVDDAANPLNDMKPEEVRALRGISLFAWNDAVDAKLKDLDLQHACVRLSDEVVRDHAAAVTARLREARYLALEDASEEGIKALAEFKRLRFLFLSRVRSFDASSLAGATDLRHLSLGGGAVANASRFEALVELRELDASWSEGMRDVAFAAKMPRLRNLNVSRSEVADLSGLADHPSIESIDADMTPVAALPAGRLKALRKLRVMSTGVTDEAVAVFTRAHPACVVRHRWQDAFRIATERVDRVRVRTGGTCHRATEEEKTLFEIEGAEKVRDFLGRIEVDEKDSGFHCMCCGEPSIELHAGQELVLTLGFHHGRSLRWRQGWPGDALLTDKSADALCRWLSDNGVKAPLKEREREKKEERAWQSRRARYRELVPEAAYKAIAQIDRDENPEAAIAVLEATVPAAADRVVLACRVVGSHDGAWSHSDFMTSFMMKNIISPAGEAELDSAFETASKDERVRRGLARWLFNRRSPDKPDLSAERVGLLAREALAHPKAVNRRRTIRALGAIGKETAVPLLREVLGGGGKVRPLAPEEDCEPGGGMVEFRPEDGDLPEDAPDAAWAAMALTRHDDKASLQAIRKLAESAQGETREKLLWAVKVLDR